MNLCVRGINFASFYEFSAGEFRSCSESVFFFYLNVSFRSIFSIELVKNNNVIPILKIKLSYFLLKKRLECRLDIIYVLTLDIQLPRWRVGITLNGLAPPRLYAVPSHDRGFQTSYVVVSLCSASSINMRGDCSFCLCW